MTIPTGLMNRALTDKERKAVKAEVRRLHDMLFDDSQYWRRGEKPPIGTPEPKYTADDLRRDRPDLFERTKLPKGHPERLTLPKAKRQATTRLLPPGIHYSKWVDGKQFSCSAEEATGVAIVGGVEALVAFAENLEQHVAASPLLYRPQAEEQRTA